MKTAGMTANQIAQRDEIRRAKEAQLNRSLLNKCRVLLAAMYVNDFQINRQMKSEATAILKKLNKP